MAEKHSRRYPRLIQAFEDICRGSGNPVGKQGLLTQDEQTEAFKALDQVLKELYPTLEENFQNDVSQICTWIEQRLKIESRPAALSPLSKKHLQKGRFMSFSEIAPKEEEEEEEEEEE